MLEAVTSEQKVVSDAGVEQDMSRLLETTAVHVCRFSMFAMAC